MFVRPGGFEDHAFLGLRLDFGRGRGMKVDDTEDDSKDGIQREVQKDSTAFDGCEAVD